MGRILIADSDVQLCKLLQQVLHDKGYDVSVVHCIESALASIETDFFDVILLDSALSDANSNQLMSQISQQFATPMLVLSALNSEETMLNSLLSGADHFMVKPINTSELVTRIMVILRRAKFESQRKHCQQKVDIVTSQLLQLPLTKTERELLQYLIANTDVVVSKSDLQINILKKELCPFDRNLDMHISNIRRKITQAGLANQHIKTMRGRGYCFVGVI